MSAGANRLRPESRSAALSCASPSAHPARADRHEISNRDNACARRCTGPPAGALAQDPGGSGTGDSGGAAFTAPPVAPLTPGGLLRGTVRWSGTLPAGGPVRVEQLDPASGAWNPVAHTTTDDNGNFTATWP